MTRPFDPRLPRRVPEIRRHLAGLGLLGVVAGILIIAQATALATALTAAADGRLDRTALTVFVGVVTMRELSVTGIFRYTDTWPAAIHLVASGLVELDSLVTGKFDLDHAAEALEADVDPASLKSVVYPS